MKLRSLLISALMNVCALCPAWASAHIIDDHQASSSASTSYFLKTLPNDILAHILTYVSGPSLHRLWETGNKTTQQHLTKNVQAFDISQSYPPNITPLPENLLKVIASRFSLLRELDVYWNKFVGNVLTHEIPLFPRLSIWNLKNCGLTTLSENLFQLPNLTSLNISLNGLGDSNSLDKIISLTNLKTLIAQHCGLTRWPQQFLQLPSLTDLDISHNHVSEGASSEVTISLKQLIRLNLEECGLTTLPKSLSQLPSLTHLNLLYNKFPNDRLPDEVLSLIQLRELKIGGHHLPPLPERITHLLSLTHLTIRSYEFEIISLLPLLRLNQLQMIDMPGDPHLKSTLPVELQPYVHIFKDFDWSGIRSY